MKPFSIILTFLLPFFGSAVVAQTGMTVFGDCYVSETASIGFFGDELTLRGDVRSEGNLIMAGKDTQTIVAHNQTIDHLVIANPTVVNLKGKLTVRESLEILQGTLDVLPLAQLHVNPSATVFLAAGRKIIHAGIALKSDSNTLPFTKKLPSGGDILAASTVQAGGGVIFKRTLSRLMTLPGFYHSPSLPALAPPPWRV